VAHEDEDWMRKRRLRWIAALATLGLLVVACGSDGDDDGAPATTAAPGDTTVTTVTTVAPAAETFGDLESPCGEGGASTASAQGVTADSITIGYGDDAGNARATGLNHQQSDAVAAMIGWCNAQGGINGRRIEGRYYDAKILEVHDVMQSACREVFMLVGEGWWLDSAQEETRVGCGLGAVPAWAVSPDLAHGPFAVQPVPNPIDFAPVQIAAAIARAFPEAIKKTAVMYANYAPTIDMKDKVVATYPSVGFEFLPCEQRYNIAGEEEWKPFVQNLKDCGAEVVYFAGSPSPNFQNVLFAAAQLDYHPIYITDAHFYDEDFAEWNAQNGGIADDVYIRQVFIPLGETGNLATKQYVDIVEASGGDVNQIGAQATSAFLLWATGAKACGDNVTRDCVLEEIGKITAWTGGGLHAPTDPSRNMPPECGLTLKLDGGEFVRFDPTEPGAYDCSTDYVKEVTGPVLDRVDLGPDRISTTYLE
jgi:ABC-type branched-subunit amino acid transport system substrate-binding protein